jgi:hypothetical protein
MSALVASRTVIPGHEELLPEDALDSRDARSWREDLVGYRSSQAPTGDLMIFRCACGCGGHAAIPVRVYAPLGRARAQAHARAAQPAHDLAVWGRGFFITGHAPDGIAAQKARSGPRVALKATA